MNTPGCVINAANECMWLISYALGSECRRVASALVAVVAFFDSTVAASVFHEGLVSVAVGFFSDFGIYSRLPDGARFCNAQDLSFLASRGNISRTGGGRVLHVHDLWRIRSVRMRERRHVYRVGILVIIMNVPRKRSDSLGRDLKSCKKIVVSCGYAFSTRASAFIKNKLI